MTLIRKIYGARYIVVMFKSHQFLIFGDRNKKQGLLKATACPKSLFLHHQVFIRKRSLQKN